MNKRREKVDSKDEEVKWARAKVQTERVREKGGGGGTEKEARRPKEPK